MKLYARTIEDLGQKFAAVDLPEHTYEICFVEDGVEPGGRFDVIVGPSDDSRAVTIRLRDAQIHVLPKASNACEVVGRKYRSE